MPRAAAWIAVAAVCIGFVATTAAGVELDLWVLLLALVVGFFAAGFAVGLRALWGAFAIAAVVLLAGWLEPSDDYDMDTRALFTIFTVLLFIVAAVAVGVGAFVRWVAAHATSRRASD